MFSLHGLHTEAVRRCSVCQVNVVLLIFEDGVKSVVFLLRFPSGKKGEFY